MNIDLSGKTALVTGSTAGIGHAIAKGLASARATVVVNGRTQGKVAAAVAAIAEMVPGAKAPWRCRRCLDGSGMQRAGRGPAGCGHPDQQCRDIRTQGLFSTSPTGTGAASTTST